KHSPKRKADSQTPAGNPPVGFFCCSPPLQSECILILPRATHPARSRLHPITPFSPSRSNAVTIAASPPGRLRCGVSLPRRLRSDPSRSILFPLHHEQCHDSTDRQRRLPLPELEGGTGKNRDHVVRPPDIRGSRWRSARVADPSVLRRR